MDWPYQMVLNFILFLPSAVLQTCTYELVPWILFQVYNPLSTDKQVTYVYVQTKLHVCWVTMPVKESSPLMNLYFPHMDVSKNRGTPKSSILIGFSIINHPFWDTPIFGNTHIIRGTKGTPNPTPKCFFSDGRSQDASGAPSSYPRSSAVLRCFRGKFPDGNRWWWSYSPLWNLRFL